LEKMIHSFFDKLTLSQKQDFIFVKGGDKAEIIPFQDLEIGEAGVLKMPF